jgi:hypothetical protein
LLAKRKRQPRRAVRDGGNLSSHALFQLLKVSHNLLLVSYKDRSHVRRQRSLIRDDGQVVSLNAHSDVSLPQVSEYMSNAHAKNDFSALSGFRFK